MEYPLYSQFMSIHWSSFMKMLTSLGLKMHPCLTPKIYAVKTVFIRKQLAKLRTSNHDLMTEKGRHDGIEVTNRTCEQCDTQLVNIIFFWSAQNMMICDGNTYHAIV